MKNASSARKPAPLAWRDRIAALRAALDMADDELREFEASGCPYAADHAMLDLAQVAELAASASDDLMRQALG